MNKTDRAGHLSANGIKKARPFSEPGSRVKRLYFSSVEYFLQQSHIGTYLNVQDLGVMLGGFDVGMPQHFADTFNGYTV